MDIFAHALWTNAIYKGAQKRQRTIWEIAEIVFWSNFPDFFSFGLVFVYNLFFGSVGWKGEAYFLQHTPQILFLLHNILYSVPIFLSIFFVVWLVRRRPYWPMAGWLLHIFIDVLTHIDFFPPHFLWPFLPKFHFEVISWGEPAFMLANYFAIAAIYAYWFFFMRPKKIWTEIPKSADQN